MPRRIEVRHAELREFGATSYSEDSILTIFLEWKPPQAQKGTAMAINRELTVTKSIQIKADRMKVLGGADYPANDTAISLRC